MSHSYPAQKEEWQWAGGGREEQKAENPTTTQQKLMPSLTSSPDVHISITLYRTDKSLHSNHQIWTFEINIAVHAENKNK